MLKQPKEKAGAEGKEREDSVQKMHEASKASIVSATI